MEWPPVFIFEPTLDNYKVLFDMSKAGSSNYGTIKINFLEPILNSVIISGGAVVVSLIIGIPAGYILARSNFKFKNFLDGMTIRGVTTNAPNSISWV